MPMSSSCVVPRERMLDLLDELREVLPPEIDEARTIIASRDALLHDAYAEAAAVREKATAEAETIDRERARSRAPTIVHDAEVQAYETVEQGKAEHATLVSATTDPPVRGPCCRPSCASRPTRMRAACTSRPTSTTSARSPRPTGTRPGSAPRPSATRAKLADDSEDYADRTLYELAMTPAARPRHRRAGAGRAGPPPRRPAERPTEPDEVYDADERPPNASRRGGRRGAPTSRRPTSGRTERPVAPSLAAAACAGRAGPAPVPPRAPPTPSTTGSEAVRTSDYERRWASRLS